MASGLHFSVTLNSRGWDKVVGKLFTAHFQSLWPSVLPEEGPWSGNKKSWRLPPGLGQMQHLMGTGQGQI